MSARLTLVCHAPTAATARAAFPDDEPLDERGRGWAAEVGGDRFTRAGLALHAPAPACRQTATALGLSARPEPALRDWDLGRWRGRTLDQVSAAEPDAVGAWLSEPDAAPHGGEPLTDLLARVAEWLTAAPAEGLIVAVTHPAVVRAAVVGALGAPATAFWRIDLAPLTATELRGRPGRWTLRSTGRPLRARS
jgi:broad specificity phosphatase PhoE